MNRTYVRAAGAFSVAILFVFGNMIPVAQAAGEKPVKCPEDLEGPDKVVSFAGRAQCPLTDKEKRRVYRADVQPQPGCFKTVEDGKEVIKRNLYGTPCEQVVNNFKTRGICKSDKPTIGCEGREYWDKEDKAWKPLNQKTNPTAQNAANGSGTGAAQNDPSKGISGPSQSGAPKASVPGDSRSLSSDAFREPLARTRGEIFNARDTGPYQFTGQNDSLGRIGDIAQGGGGSYSAGLQLGTPANDLRYALSPEASGQASYSSSNSYYSGSHGDTFPSTDNYYNGSGGSAFYAPTLWQSASGFDYARSFTPGTPIWSIARMGQII